MAKTTNDVIKNLRKNTVELQAMFAALQAKAGEHHVQVKKISSELMQKLRERERIEEERRISELRAEKEMQKAIEQTEAEAVSEKAKAAKAEKPAESGAAEAPVQEKPAPEIKAKASKPVQQPQPQAETGAPEEEKAAKAASVQQQETLQRPQSEARAERAAPQGQAQAHPDSKQAESRKIEGRTPQQGQKDVWVRRDLRQEPFNKARPFPPRPFSPRPDWRPENRGPREAGAGGRMAPKLIIPKDITTHVEKEKASNYDPRKKNFTHAVDSAEKRAAKSKKSMLKILPGRELDEEIQMGSRKRRKKPEQIKIVRPEPIVIEKAVMTGEVITVKDLAEKIGKPSSEIIKKLLVLGIIATINREIDYDTALLIANDFGIELELKIDKTFEEVLFDEDREDDVKELLPRPPVVTIMGHVDHGKTSLLDAIRKTNVTEGEAGGITQHIGAYTVEINGRSITFLDTPGHEAFTAMRARGANATDIAVLVVAADDGVMPQTIEAIDHAKAAGVPIVVAINKIDKPGANIEKVKQGLTEYGLLTEEWGGETVMVPVSAKTQEGIPHLLEMLLLVADVLELKANPNRFAKGTVIEAKLDKGRGPVATVLVHNGTLRIGDTIVAGTVYGRVRVMLNDKMERVESAPPSQPVEVLGFSEVPEAGDMLYAVEEDKLSRQVAQERRDKIKAAQLKKLSKVSLDDLFIQIAQGQIKDLNIIIKADVQGSFEALRQALEKLSNPQVRVRVIHSGVGAITKTDVMLASASNAIIIGFNVRPDAIGRTVAEDEKVDVRLYRVIYNAIDDVEKAMKGLLAPVFEESIIGHAEVRATFKVSGIGTIAGCYVIDGKMQRNAKVRLTRDSVVIHEGVLDTLKRFKDDAKEALQGFECGIKLENYNEIKEGDVIEAFEMREVEQ
ncbi:MAG: translation initiation factor IF-2 [Bacillota bacterium]|nr:translation initiation factor IF-2 [Bacillota bacterium]